MIEIFALLPGTQMKCNFCPNVAALHLGATLETVKIMTAHGEPLPNVFLCAYCAGKVFTVGKCSRKMNINSE